MGRTPGRLIFRLFASRGRPICRCLSPLADARTVQIRGIFRPLVVSINLVVERDTPAVGQLGDWRLALVTPPACIRLRKLCNNMFYPGFSRIVDARMPNAGPCEKTFELHLTNRWIIFK